jgi:small nuclear ribonucleoprotein F
MTTFVNPTPFLAELTGSAVVVRLKWGMEYKGVLRSTDKHMNLQVRPFWQLFQARGAANALPLSLQLLNAEEWIDGALAGRLGEILIR